MTAYEVFYLLYGPLGMVATALVVTLLTRDRPNG